jgi:endo-1,4-beta-D-glucanase Y
MKRLLSYCLALPLSAVLALCGCLDDDGAPGGNADLAHNPNGGDGGTQHDMAMMNNMGGGDMSNNMGGGDMSNNMGGGDMATSHMPGAYGFGSHPMPYPSDVLHPTGSQASLDSAVEQAYDTWKGQYVKQGCGGYYVLSGGGTGAGVGDEVSEGHGYGMVITAIMAGYDPNAQTVFDGMYTFFHKFPTATHQNLMAWTVDVAGGCKPQTDSATDGDLDIGFALLLADKQWPNQGYLQKAMAVIADLKDGDMHQTTHEPTLGDWATSTDPQYNATRPSDFMLDHFRSFGNASGDATWMMGVSSVYDLIATIQTNNSPQTGLLPDFVINTTATPTPAGPNFLEGAADGDYFYNSCRVPWRVATDYLVSSDGRSKTAMQAINKWIMGHVGGDPSKILDGYTLTGGKAPGQSGPSSAFSSPFGVSAMLGSGTGNQSADQAWLDAIWSSRAINEDYYADSITMLCMIVMSGNWWSP